MMCVCLHVSHQKSECVIACLMYLLLNDMTMCKCAWLGSNGSDNFHCGNSTSIKNQQQQNCTKCTPSAARKTKRIANELSRLGPSEHAQKRKNILFMPERGVRFLPGKRTAKNLWRAPKHEKRRAKGIKRSPKHFKRAPQPEKRTATRKANSPFYFKNKP